MEWRRRVSRDGETEKLLPKCPPLHLEKLVSMAEDLKMLLLRLPAKKRTKRTEELKKCNMI